MRAADRGHVKIIQLLLHAGAAVNDKDTTVTSSFFLLVFTCFVSVVVVMLLCSVSHSLCLFFQFVIVCLSEWSHCFDDSHFTR